MQDEGTEDETPLFWPHMWQTKSQVLQQAKEQAMPGECSASKREFPNIEQVQLKRRRMLNFAEFVEIAKRNDITNENEFWKVAGRERQAGNHALWNYGGKVIVSEKICKMLRKNRN